MRILLVLIFFIGYYLQVHIYEPIYFPFAPAIMSGVVLLYLYGKLKFESIIFFVLIFLICFSSLIPLLFSMHRIDFFRPQFNSAILLVFSIVASVGMMKTVSYDSCKIVELRYRNLAILFVVAAILEVVGILKPVSDTVRLLIHPSEIVYGTGRWNDIRDITTFGIVRPKVFASEPSYLGTTISIFCSMSLAASASLRNVLIVVVTLCIGYVFVRSPTMFVGLLFAAMTIKEKYSWRQLAENPFALPLILLTLFFGVVFLYNQSSRVGSDIQSIDPSVFVRIIAPALVLWETISIYPLFGFGFGAKESLLEVINLVFSSPLAPDYVFQSESAVSSNSIISTFIQLGLVGGIIVSYSVVKLFKTFLPKIPLRFWVFILLYGLTVPPNNTVIFWGGILAVLGALISGAQSQLAQAGRWR